MSGTELVRWISLGDASARLRTQSIEGRKHLFVTGLAAVRPEWAQLAASGFLFPPSRRYLMRAVQQGERLGGLLAELKAVFPRAFIREMPRDDVFLTFSKAGTRPADQGGEDRQIELEIASALRLGRNQAGDEVYETGAGRMLVRYDGDKRTLLREADGGARPHVFLRAPSFEDLSACADGPVQSILRGEVLRQDDLARFVYAVTGRGEGAATGEDFEAAHAAIDASIMRHLAGRNLLAADAFGESVLLYEGAPAYGGAARGRGAMPLPLSIIAQRLLGDTSQSVVAYPNAYDGASFAFLPAGTRIHAYRGDKDLSQHAGWLDRSGLEWMGDFQPAKELGLDAIFFNADPARGMDGGRVDYSRALSALRALGAGGRAVLVLAGDNPLQPGLVQADSAGFYGTISKAYEVEEAFEVARELTAGVGTGASLRVIALRNRKPDHTRGRGLDVSMDLPVVHSWDQAKARVDHALMKYSVPEAEGADIELEDAIGALENALQRPYVAFSKVSEPTLMIPKELQGPTQKCLSNLEARVGSVDDYVTDRLGLAGREVLAANFAAEQVDTLAIAISRLESGLGVIMGGDTGTGKGRTIAGAISWALQQGRPVVFVTDKAHLFSALARDMRDIGEWGRALPLITNADGAVVDLIGDLGTLAEPLSPAEMAAVIDRGATLHDLGRNLVMTTYSQLGGADSEKARWLKNQLRGALLVTDEAHIAAGSDSNISRQISEMVMLAHSVCYASATWAKSPDNIHIFVRALPASVNVGTLADTMKRGGEAFSEVFTAMLAEEGAFVRHEHDASKTSLELLVDSARSARNARVADQVAEVMSQLAVLGGEIGHVVTRLSKMNVAALIEARNGRKSAQRAHAEATQTRIFRSSFGAGSMLYQVMRRTLTSLKVDLVAESALADLAAGEKPILVVDDTGDAFVSEALADAGWDGEGEEPLIAMPTIRTLLKRILRQLSEVKTRTVTYEEALVLSSRWARDGDGDEDDDDGDEDLTRAGAEQHVVDRAEAAAPAEDVELADVIDDVERGQDPVAKPERKVGLRRKVVYTSEPLEGFITDPEVKRSFLVAIREITERIDAIEPLPLNVIDALRERLEAGGARVGELTGRSRLLRKVDGEVGAEDARWRVQRRPKGKALVNSTVRAFNGGEIDAAIINRSVATGTSMHASPRFKDRRRRVMYLLQTPENPTDFQQLLGRANRRDQVSSPRYVTPSTGIKGELRQLILQNRKQMKLSAAVRSDRRSATQINDVPDLLTPLGNQAARDLLLANTDLVKRLALPDDVLSERYSGSSQLASLLTQRIPLLKSSEQKAIYDQLEALFEDAVTAAEVAGESVSSTALMDVKASFGPRQVIMGFDAGEHGSAFDAPVYAQRIQWVDRERPFGLEQVIPMIAASRQALVDAGYAQRLDGSTPESPLVSMAAVADRLYSLLEARARMSVAQTAAAGFDEALAEPGRNAVKDAVARARYIRDVVMQLAPGAILLEQVGRGFARNTRRVVVGLTPPEGGRLGQLALWRLSTIAPGTGRVLRTNLAALLGEVKIDKTTGQAYSERADIRGDLLEVHSAVQRLGPEQARRVAGSYVYEMFAMRWTGERRKEAIALSGNLYAASEFASATKLGNGVIVTDERGQRHRAVIMIPRFSPQMVRWMPLRVAQEDVAVRMIAALPEGKHHAATSFQVAWARTVGSSTGKSAAEILVIPGEGIWVSVPRGAQARIGRQLRLAQKRIVESSGIDRKNDPARVTLGGGKASEKAAKAEMVLLNARTPEAMERAVQMLFRGPGCEIYVPRLDTDILRAALDAVKEVSVERVRASLANSPERLAAFERSLEAQLPEEMPSEEERLEALRRISASVGAGDAPEQGDPEVEEAEEPPRMRA